MTPQATDDVYNALQHRPRARRAGRVLPVACVSRRRQDQQQKGVPRTDIKTIARGAAFIGSLLLLYGVATGFWLSSSTQAADTAALRQHTIVGVLGTVLCVIAVALLLRQKN